MALTYPNCEYPNPSIFAISPAPLTSDLPRINAHCAQDNPSCLRGLARAIMSETLCFQAALGVSSSPNCHGLNFKAKSSRQVLQTAEPRAPPSRRPRMTSVTTPQPPAYSQKPQTSHAVPTTTGAIASFSSETPVQFVTELTSPSAFDDVFSSLTDESADGREGPTLVLVEAYTKSCRACIGVRRIYERIAEEQQDKIRCFRFDAFNSGNLAQKLGVRGLPTFIVYKRSTQSDDEGNGWRRVDHFSTSKRSVIEQNITDNL